MQLNVGLTTLKTFEKLNNVDDEIKNRGMIFGIEVILKMR